MNLSDASGAALLSCAGLVHRRARRFLLLETDIPQVDKQIYRGRRVLVYAVDGLCFATYRMPRQKAPGYTPPCSSAEEALR